MWKEIRNLRSRRNCKSAKHSTWLIQLFPNQKIIHQSILSTCYIPVDLIIDDTYALGILAEALCGQHLVLCVLHLLSHLTVQQKEFYLLHISLISHFKNYIFIFVCLKGRTTQRRREGEKAGKREMDREGSNMTIIHMCEYVSWLIFIMFKTILQNASKHTVGWTSTLTYI